jgi:hypothetical protein
LERERAVDDALKMSVPCFGRVYKRQMMVNLIAGGMIGAYVIIALTL